MVQWTLSSIHRLAGVQKASEPPALVVLSLLSISLGQREEGHALNNRPLPSTNCKLLTRNVPQGSQDDDDDYHDDNGGCFDRPPVAIGRTASFL